jgi:hypothetical protein
MPDKSDFEYLISANCTYTLIANYRSTGIPGLLVTGKGEFSNNSIFLPNCKFVSGYEIEDGLDDSPKPIFADGYY